MALTQHKLGKLELYGNTITITAGLTGLAMVL